MHTAQGCIIVFIASLGYRMEKQEGENTAFLEEI